MQSRAALGNVFDHLRPGAPVAAAGGKWPAPWSTRDTTTATCKASSGSTANATSKP